MRKDFSASSFSAWSNPSVSAGLNFRRRARDFHGLPSCKDNPSKSSSATTPSLTKNKNKNKNVNVFLRKLRIEQLNFCFFYEQQPFIKDPDLRTTSFTKSHNRTDGSWLYRTRIRGCINEGLPSQDKS